MTRIARLPSLTAALFCTLASACAGAAGGEEAAAIARGKALAEAQCAQCHAIEATGMSPYPAAPIWREMVQTKDTDELATLFGEGKLLHRDGIASMPEFTLTPQQIGELIAYMKTLRTG